jgi:hypothetical protein
MSELSHGSGGGIAEDARARAGEPGPDLQLRSSEGALGLMELPI